MSGNTFSSEEELVGKEKVRVMLESLKSPNILVRSTGSQNLADLAIEESETTVPILMKALEDREWYSVRFGALEAITELGIKSEIRLSDENIRKLIEYLDDEDTDFSAKVAECLGFQNNQNCVKPLINHLSTENEEYREFIVRALGNLKTEEAIPKLHELLADSHYVQTACLYALGLIGEKDSNFNIEPIVSKLFSSQNEVIKSSAASLGKIQNPKAVVPLIKALSNQASTPETRNTILNAIKAFNEAMIESEILTYSTEPNEQIDLIESLTYHLEYPRLTQLAEEEKKSFIGSYSRSMRRMKNEIDSINAFVADTFKKLNSIKKEDKLQLILDSIPKKLTLLKKVDFDQIEHYTWVKNELFQQLKQAHEWYTLGEGALKELEEAVVRRMETI